MKLTKEQKQEIADQQAQKNQTKRVVNGGGGGYSSELEN